MLHKSLSALVAAARHAARKSPQINSILYESNNVTIFDNIFQHDKMIADSIRIDSYNKAIQKYVLKDDIVVDLGTGTGILALIARKKNPKTIYAIDHGSIIEFGNRLSASNNVFDINFIRTHSADFTPDNPASIILHEQMGDKLFDERMIENVCDLRDRILAPNGKIIPSKFQFFLEPFSVSDEFRVPYIWEHNNIHGISYSGMKNYVKNLSKNDVDRSYSWCYAPREGGSLLCSPKSVFEFDLMTISKNDIPKKFVFNKEIIKSGRFDGLCTYFRVHFDDEIVFDTSPVSIPTNWSKQVCIFRCEQLFVKAGDTLNITWTASDIGDPALWDIKIQ